MFVFLFIFEKTKIVVSFSKRSCTEVQSELYVALDQQYITNAEFQDVYDHAGRTRATVRGFIKYLLAYEQSQRKKGSAPADHAAEETRNREP